MIEWIGLGTWAEFNFLSYQKNCIRPVDEMIPTDFDHTIYELEGDVQDLAISQKLRTIRQESCKTRS